MPLRLPSSQHKIEISFISSAIPQNLIFSTATLGIFGGRSEKKRVLNQPHTSEAQMRCLGKRKNRKTEENKTERKYQIRERAFAGCPPCHPWGDYAEKSNPLSFRGDPAQDRLRLAGGGLRCRRILRRNERRLRGWGTMYF